MISAKQLKAGTIIEFKNDLYRVLEAKHHAPGKGQAVVQTKLRSVTTGTQTEHRFRSTESVEKASLHTSTVQFLYQEGEHYYFMDNKSYEQFHLSGEDLGPSACYLVPNMEMQAISHEGRALGVELPKTVTMKVVQTDPYLKTATATNAFKPAKLETGVDVQVPGFITEGELIEIDTETGKYLGRAK